MDNTPIINETEFKFAAISPKVVENIPQITEKYSNSDSFVYLGTDNRLDGFYLSLYEKSQTLSAVINATVDYVLGDGLRVNGNEDEEFEALYKNIAFDYITFGYAAIAVHKKINGNVLEYIPSRYLRSDSKNNCFWYSKKFAEKYGRHKTLVLPKWTPDTEAPTSILFIKNNTLYTYGRPVYASVISACQSEADIAEYNLNQIANGFSAGYHIAFRNGTPSDKVKEEIERNIDEKFCGAENANRVLLTFSPDKDHAPVIQKLEQDAATAKYEQLSVWSRQSICTAFRCNPQLIGINLENLGFNVQEFSECFKLFNRTTIKPIQKALNRALNKIGMDVQNVQFTIDFE